MLRRRYRLKSAGLFKRALKAPKILETPYFSVFAVSGHSPRFGFIVSRKIDKRATRRNRIRRRLRELVRTESLFQALTQYRAVVFVARPAALKASYSELKQALCQGPLSLSC
jgi:ribonuclease P protein component